MWKYQNQAVKIWGFGQCHVIFYNFSRQAGPRVAGCFSSIPYHWIHQCMCWTLCLTWMKFRGNFPNAMQLPAKTVQKKKRWRWDPGALPKGPWIQPWKKPNNSSTFNGQISLHVTIRCHKQVSCHKAWGKNRKSPGRGLWTQNLSCEKTLYILVRENNGFEMSLILVRRVSVKIQIADNLRLLVFHLFQHWRVSILFFFGKKQKIVDDAKCLRKTRTTMKQ